MSVTYNFVCRNAADVKFFVHQDERRQSVEECRLLHSELWIVELLLLCGTYHLVNTVLLATPVVIWR